MTRPHTESNFLYIGPQSAGSHGIESADQLNQFSELTFSSVSAENPFVSRSEPQAAALCRELFRVLEYGGELTITVPDHEHLFKAYLESENRSEKRVIMEQIFGRDSQFYQTGFSETVLAEILESAGFTACRRLDAEPNTLRISALKPQKPVDETSFIDLYQIGSAHFEKGEYQESLNRFRQAAELQPNFAPVWYNIGLCRGKLGDIQGSLENLDKALILDPDFSEAHAVRESLRLEVAQTVQTGWYQSNILKVIELQNRGAHEEALAVLEHMHALFPDDAPILFAIGGAEQILGRSKTAAEHLEQAVHLAPDFTEAWYNLGIVYQSLKQSGKALACYDTALQTNPRHTSVWVNRGALLAEMKRLKEALLNYEKLLLLDPDNPGALCNRGIILSDFKQRELAAESFKRLVETAPNHDFALGLLFFEKMYMCQWHSIDTLRSELTEGILSGRKICSALAVTALTDNPEIHLRCSQIFAEHSNPVKPSVRQQTLYSHRKIRIGFISPDFREHPVGHLTAGIFEHFSKERFEISAFSLGPDDGSSIRRRMVNAFDHFIDIRTMTPFDAAAVISSMEIDILVDLAGYTADSRTEIFSYRPTPIQVNFLGYSNTMGSEIYDYIIADQYVIPPENRPFFSEKAVSMPTTYLPTDSELKFSEPALTRQEYGLPENAFVYCCFNHDYKITPEMFALWMNLLRNNPGSVLWLMKLNDPAERNLTREAEAAGIDPHRLIFAQRVPSIESHLARYKAADLYLDTFPCNGHSTCSDVLRSGLPAVTCRGGSFASRAASSIIHTAGVPELITDSLQEYETLVQKLTDSPQLLQDIKRKLENALKSGIPFNTAIYTRDLETAFETMHEKWKNGEQPDHFTVESPTETNNRTSE